MTYTTNEEIAAAARLRDAAPDLLEALETISGSLEGQDGPVAKTIRTWADAAIAKAKGETL
jgi:hypothetical protein